MESNPTIIRTRKNRENPYTMIARAPLNDAALSWEARGVLAYLLDKPDDWEVRFQDLVHKGPGAEDRMRRILHELEAAGYVQRTRFKGDRGRFVWITLVFETPALAAAQASSAGEIPPPAPPPSRQNRHMESAPPYAGFPSMDEPSMDSPYMENRHIYKDGTERNTNLPNTEGERDAPPLSTINFTMDDSLRSWWLGKCAGAGIPAREAYLTNETEKWQDACATGARPGAAVNAVADWRQWMQRAIHYATQHPEVLNDHLPGSIQGRSTSPARAALDGDALARALSPLAGPPGAAPTGP